jgi:hypothetical protein
VPSWLRTVLALALAWATNAVVAAPSPAQASDPPSALQRFLGHDGLGKGNVHRSDLEALWGRADIEKPVAASKATWRTSHALLEYKTRGLLFATVPNSYGKADPVVEMGHFSLPFEDCTPQGLCLGMPEAQAMPIISAHYKIRGDDASSFGNPGRITGRSLWGKNKGWRQTHYVSFGFNEGRLYTMSFQLEPTPFITVAQIGSGLASLLGFAVLVLVGLGIEAVKKKRAEQDEPLEDSPAWEIGRLGLGIALLVAAVGGMVLGFGSLSSGDGYAKMASLIMGLGAAGLAVVALLVFSGSRNAIVSRGASALLLIGLIVLAAAKLL